MVLPAVLFLDPGQHFFAGSVFRAKKRTMDPAPNKRSGSNEIRARSTALTSWNPRGATYEPTLFDQTSYGRYFRLLLPLVQGV